MDRTDLKEMFNDVVGGVAVDDDTLNEMVTQSLRLLNQLTAHIGVDFMTDYTLLVMQTMQYYYDLAQRNYEAAKLNYKEIVNQCLQAHNDFVQVEQADFANYIGDRG